MRLITRGGWGARAPRKSSSFSNVQSIFVHHTTGRTLGADQSAQWVRNIQADHMDRQRWDDIGYSFLFDFYGNVFEGRGWNIIGAHTAGHNSSGHGFAYLGDGDNALSPAAEDALRWLINEHDRRYGEKPIRGHRDVNATHCPGNWLYSNRTRFRGGRPVAVPAGSNNFSPPVVLEPIVSSWVPPEGGVLQLAASGAIYAWAGARFRGGANGKSYFRGRRAHHIQGPNDAQKRAGYHYVIVATSGEQYGFPEIR